MVATRLSSSPTWGWWHPFAKLDHMAKQMDFLNSAMFGRSDKRLFPAKVFPAINITENKDSYYVRAELPGIKSSDLNVEVTGKNLSISGERKIQSVDENAKYHRREREAGKFSRVIALPGEVDVDIVDAKLLNGILTVSIAKSVAAKPKKITVN